MLRSTLKKCNLSHLIKVQIKSNVMMAIGLHNYLNLSVGGTYLLHTFDQLTGLLLAPTDRTPPAMTGRPPRRASQPPGAWIQTVPAAPIAPGYLRHGWWSADTCCGSRRRADRTHGR